MGDSQGAAHTLMLVPGTSSRWCELAGGWGDLPGAPTAPQQPLGAAGLPGRASPSLLSLWARAQHSLLLAAPLPHRDIKTLCGPSGCGWGSEGPGRSCGPLPGPEDPCGPREEAPGWQGLQRGCLCPCAWTEPIQTGNGGGTAERSAGGPHPRHFLPLFVAASGARSPCALPCSRSP